MEKDLQTRGSRRRIVEKTIVFIGVGAALLGGYALDEYLEDNLVGDTIIGVPNPNNLIDSRGK